MIADLNRVTSELESCSKAIQEHQNQKENLKKRSEQLENELLDLAHEFQNLEKKGNEDMNQKYLKQEMEIQMKSELLEHEVQKQDIKDNIKREHDNIKALQNQLYRQKKEYKQTENAKKRALQQTKDFQNNIREREIKIEFLKSEMKQQEKEQKNREEHISSLEQQKVERDRQASNNQEDAHILMKNIKKAEINIQEMHKEQLKWQKKVQWLGVEREQMARKASQSMILARETTEELKVKELIIMDLSKKLQEAQMKLDNYVSMYEEVKNARNKYVKAIQNSSQDLAELKERIKILQNEIEILRNESAEKSRALKGAEHCYKQVTHARDNIRAELNKQDQQMKAKHSIIEQQINEIEKLNLIINNLEKEMMELKQKYENACESRNFTGIQLIDRNDELCVLYEKSNILEQIQKNGEKAIREKEDELRMLCIDEKELQKQIEVVRKQIPKVPELSEQLLSLKAENDSVLNQEKKLSQELEDPANKARQRELTGEDPDQEALNAKIQVLEERLNAKKEQLLEKELVLEEITNLADKLRKQALEGRQGTLELAEKVNHFQARIKDLTRKMMATVSELSMFQATALSLQQEREQKEKLLEDSTDRFNKGLPPTEEAERQWYRMERNKKIQEEEYRARKEREELERNAPAHATRTTAEPRPNAYIPQEGKIQLPIPYGGWTPYKPSELGSNMRHFRKPEPRPIEI